MPFILILLLYSFTSLSPNQSKEQQNLSKAAALDSSLTTCASEAAIRTFAGTEIYYGTVVEYTAYVMAKDLLIVRYALGIQRDILWVSNKKILDEKRASYGQGDDYKSKITNEIILINLLSDSLFLSSPLLSENRCFSISKNESTILMRDDLKVRYEELNFKFLRIFYGLSLGGGVSKKWVFENPQHHVDYFVRDYIPDEIKNKHVLIRYLNAENICICDSVQFCHQPIMFEVFANLSNKKPDTAIVYFPCPDRYFGDKKDSFALKPVVLKCAYANNRYRIDTSSVPAHLIKYVFMGFSNEIIKQKNE